MSELTARAPQETGLTIAEDQTSFTEMQVAGLRHLGVEDADQGDLAVFFHVVKRTGLDPFARQIYMISRKSKGKVKQTIQTGIDGFRLIGRRAADRAGELISVEAPEWAHPDGSWRPVWVPAWGTPLAARITIRRAGEPFTAVALFEEYAQTKFDGGLTQMWAQRPAGQIAKCAEALAWRLAFPQDLAGVYVEDEMQQADSEPRPAPSGGRAAVAEALGRTEPEPDVVEAEVVDEEPEPGPMITRPQQRAMHAAMTALGITDRADRLTYASQAIGRVVGTSTELTVDEASRLIDQAQADLAARAEGGDPS